MYIHLCIRLRSSSASLHPAIRRRKLLSDPYVGALRAKTPTCPILQRTCFSQTTVVCRTSRIHVKGNYWNLVNLFFTLKNGVKLNQFAIPKRRRSSTCWLQAGRARGPPAPPLPAGARVVTGPSDPKHNKHTKHHNNTNNNDNSIIIIISSSSSSINNNNNKHNDKLVGWSNNQFNDLVTCHKFT